MPVSKEGLAHGSSRARWVCGRGSAPSESPTLNMGKVSVWQGHCSRGASPALNMGEVGVCQGQCSRGASPVLNTGEVGVWQGQCSRGASPALNTGEVDELMLNLN